MWAWMQTMWALGPSLLPVFGPFIAGAAVAAILLVWLELLLWSDRGGVSLPWKMAVLATAGFVLTTGFSYALAIFIFWLIHVIVWLAIAAWLVTVFLHVRERATFGIARAVGLAAVLLTSWFWADWFIDLVRNDQSAQAIPFNGDTHRHVEVHKIADASAENACNPCHHAITSADFRRFCHHASVTCDVTRKPEPRCQAHTLGPHRQTRSDQAAIQYVQVAANRSVTRQLGREQL